MQFGVDVEAERQKQQWGKIVAVGLSLTEQADLVEQAGAESLLFCLDAWALRHRFINRATGETTRARCNKWSCPFCGPRKVDRWRRLIELAQPTLFVTLSRVGRTVEEAARTLTTVLQYLRRGSRGRGRGHVGAREAYPIEFFATLEEHSDLEGVGFHWHLLIVGVDYLPKQVVSDALRSATRHLYPGGSYIVDVQRVRRFKSVGYVTKYLTKEVHRKQRGVVQQQQRVSVPVYEGVPGTEYTVGQMARQADGTVTLVMEQRYAAYDFQRDEQGEPVMEEVEQVNERPSKAHRVRYSQHFFPGKTKDLWRFLCEGKGLEDLLSQGGTLETSCQECGQGEGEEELPEAVGQDEQGQEEQLSGWILHEAEKVPVGSSAADRRRLAEEAYERMRRTALVEALEGVRAGKRKVRRRVLSIWEYQRRRAVA